MELGVSAVADEAGGVGLTLRTGTKVEVVELGAVAVGGRGWEGNEGGI